MKEIGLHKFANRLANDLSGGMKRRLSIAISLIGHSEIVFLDEPTTGNKLLFKYSNVNAFASFFS